MMSTIIGWDISTSYIGVSLIVDGSLLGLWGEDLGKLKTMYEKYDRGRLAATKLMDMLSKSARESCIHYVEDRLGNFTKGLTTLQTLMVLAQFNAVMSCHLNDLSPGRVKHILPVTVKRIVGFKKVDGEDVKVTKSKLASELYPSFVVGYTPGGNLRRGDGDKADAILLAVAGSKVESGEAKIEPRKKASRGKKGLRRSKDRQG